jgi:tight adherence protein C
VTPAALLAATAVALGTIGLADLAGSLRRGAGRRRAVRPGLLAAVARVGRLLGPRAPRSLAARIEMAGLEVPAGDVMAVKAGAAPGALALALLLPPAAPGRLGTAAIAAAAGAGFLAPDAWLRRRIRARARAVEAELADVLDLLRVAIAAGLAPQRALAEVGRRHPGVLAGELRRAAARTALGTPAERALARLEARCPGAGVPALAAALRRAERHGAPLGPVLAAQAAQARARSAQRVAEAAARAAPQIQLAVALLLVPAVLLLVAAALLPALTGGEV